MGQLEGKVAVVTGSTSGIGLGIAEALEREGADVLLNGFGDAAEIERLRAGMADRYGVKVRYSAADMSRPDAIRGMIEQAARELGKVDILVNNAGIQHTAPVHEFPVEKWDAIIAINLTAAFHAIRAALPGMLERNWGRVINVASAHGLVASAQKSAYVAAKHGIVGLTKVVALETATTGVTCNAICPGWVLTPLVQKQIDDRATKEGIPVERAKLELLAEKQPSHEFVTPEQLGGLAVFLCSPAADQLRGQALAMDGAWTAQ
jgi:3-hydroxybutyrate dehydrogenase